MTMEDVAPVQPTDAPVLPVLSDEQQQRDVNLQGYRAQWAKRVAIRLSELPPSSWRSSRTWEQVAQETRIPQQWAQEEASDGE